MCAKTGYGIRTLQVPVSLFLNVSLRPIISGLQTLPSFSDNDACGYIPVYSF